MFKRRRPRSFLGKLRTAIYPQGGWQRALGYISYRIKRIPDSPHKIALGIACGVYVCFTPFFGFHFFLAAALAFMLRGNVWAAIAGTFFGNPLTFPPIAVMCYTSGTWLLQTGNAQTGAWREVRTSFTQAWWAIWEGTKSLFGYGTADWDGFVDFVNNLVLPYMLGGLAPGLATAALIYFSIKPLIVLYQKNRHKRILEKWQKLRKTGQRDE